MTMRKCIDCQQCKPLNSSHFHVKNRNGKPSALFHYKCKPCRTLYVAEHRKARGTNRKAERLRWHHNNKLYANVGRAIRLELNGQKAGKKWSDLVGYTIDDLKVHIERQFVRGMSWDNYGDYWQIDHITPASSFTITGPSCPHLKACWALSNLRPLEATRNLRKSNIRTHLI